MLPVDVMDDVVQADLRHGEDGGAGEGAELCPGPDLTDPAQQTVVSHLPSNNYRVIII